MLTSLRVPPRPVALGRILLGLGLLLTSLEGAALLADLRSGRVLTPGIPGLLTADDLPTAWWLAVMAAGALAVVVGVGVRTGLLVCAAGDVLLMVTDVQLVSNHRVLAVLLALFFVAAGSDHALSPGAAARRARRPDVPWWPQLLALSAVSSCYLFAGLSKVNPAFLHGAELSDLQWLTVPSALVTPFAATVVLTEVGIGLGLWSRRARRLAVAAGVALHLSIVVLLGSPIVFAAFALLCFSAYPLALTRPAVADRPRPAPSAVPPPP